MTYSEVQITFNDGMSAFGYVQFDVTSNGNTSVIKEEWWAERNRPYLVPTPVSGDTLPENERSAINFVESFNLDYNYLGIYEVTRNGIVVTIKAKSPNVTFSNATIVSISRIYSLAYAGATSVVSYTDIYAQGGQTITVTANTTVIALPTPSTQSGPTVTTTPGAITNNDVVFNITNYTGTAFNISQTTINQATDPCNNVTLNIQTTTQADSISSPVSQSVTTNPIAITRPRSENVINIAVSKGTETKTAKVCVPKLLSTYIDIEQIRNPTQTAINVNRKAPLFSDQTTTEGVFYPLTFEYSTDNVTWQSSNSFSGLADGNHTVYIRDNIGCSISIPFTINAFTPNLIDFDGVFEVSNLNSIRFKEHVSDTVRKLVTNTLSMEERDKMPIQNFSQWLQKDDVLTIQVKSNYGTNEAKLIACDGTETALTMSKKTDNMDKSDVRDGTIVIGANDVIGVRFGEGKTYDPATSQEDGSYNLGTALMTWVNEGDFISLAGKGWLKITDIVPPTDDVPYTVAYTTSYNDGFYTNNQVIKVSTVYNVVDFERYEFILNCSTLEGYYCIQIDGQDTDFDNKVLLSERLWIKESHRPHFLFDYYSTTNNEINYGTGIRHKLRLPYAVQLKWKPNNEQEVYVTDTNTILLESSVREFYELVLLPLPTAMAQKVVLALSLDRLFIDGQSYVMEGEPEATPLGTTNLYSIKATLIKADYVFETTSEVAIVEISTQGVPLQIDTDSLLLIN